MKNIAPPQSTSHRTRILESLETCLDAKSFRDITLTDIAAAAHISRRTFYEHFANKDECLLALSEETSAHIMKAILTSFSGADSWEDKVEKISHAYLQEIQKKTVRSVNLALLSSSNRVGCIGTRRATTTPKNCRHICRFFM